MDTIKIQKKNVIKAYNNSNDEQKKLLEALFGKKIFKPKDITERIRTFEDACRELGGEHPFVMAFDCYLENVHDANIQDANMIAYLKLRIICAALNEGWEPQFTKGEKRWIPWFFLYTKDELNQKSADWKSKRTIVPTGDYQNEYAGFASAHPDDAPSYAPAGIGSRLCLKNENLANYCGKQFIHLWADFHLMRRK